MSESKRYLDENERYLASHWTKVMGRFIEGNEAVTYVQRSQVASEEKPTYIESDYIGAYPNLNDQMTPEQAEDFRRYMQTSEGVAEITDDGQALTFVFPDQPTSVLSIEEAVRLRLEREQNLGD